jgi:hypothetical protein
LVLIKLRLQGLPKNKILDKTLDEMRNYLGLSKAFSAEIKFRIKISEINLNLTKLLLPKCYIQ